MSVIYVAKWTDESLCAVCNRKGLVRFDWRDGRMHGHGLAPCPHSPADPCKAMPVLCVPWRDETPRKVA